MEKIETIEHNGYRIDVSTDDYDDGPNDWDDSSVFLVGFHNQFTVSRDEIDRDTVRAIACGGKYEDGSEHSRARELMKAYRVYRLDARIYSVADNPHLQLEEELTGTKRTVEEAYSEYDSLFFGAVFVSRKEARTGATALKLAAGLLETWDDYLRGNVYSFTITDPDGEIVGACGGFYGYPYTDMLAEAKAEADGYRKERDAKRVFAAEEFVKYGTVYDNGGKTTADRFTVVYDGEVFGMSENPKAPDGFNQYAGDVRKFTLENNPIVGARVMFSSLPKEVQEAIIDRVIEAPRNYTMDPAVCSSSLNEDGIPATPGETAHRWDEDTTPNTCAECGAERDEFSDPK